MAINQIMVFFQNIQDIDDLKTFISINLDSSALNDEDNVLYKFTSNIESIKPNLNCGSFRRFSFTAETETEFEMISDFMNQSPALRMLNKDEFMGKDISVYMTSDVIEKLTSVIAESSVEHRG